MACQKTTFTLTGHVAIDDTRNAYLDETAARYATLLPGAVSRHRTRDAAVACCLAHPGHANIVGHGDVGVIGTGCGAEKDIFTTDTHLDAEHLGNWTRGSGMTELTLVGCFTGAGEAGAELLFKLAEATGAIVKAPAGFVHIGAGCEDLNLDPQTEWQIARPGVRPEPIPVADHPNTFDPERIVLVVGGIRYAFAATDVRAVRLVATASQNKLESGQWDGLSGLEALAFVQFDQPLARGVLGGMRTGHMELEFEMDGAVQQRTFTIYNDRLLQDTANEDICYRINLSALRTAGG